MPPEASRGTADTAPSPVSDLRMRVVTTFWRRATLMAREIGPADLRTPPPAAKGAGSAAARIARLDHSGIDDYLRFRPRTPRAEAERRMARGDVAVAAWIDGRIAHAAWVSTGRAHIPYLGCDLVLEPTEILVHDSWTDPVHRQSGLAHARMLWVFREWANLGYRRCLAIVAEENEVGRRAMTSAGYREVGRYACLRLGPWSRCWDVGEQGTAMPRPVAHAAR